MWFMSFGAASGQVMFFDTFTSMTLPLNHTQNRSRDQRVKQSPVLKCIIDAMLRSWSCASPHDIEGGVCLSLAD